SPAPAGPAWMVAPVRGAAPSAPLGRELGQALAITQSLPRGGGLVIVYLDRLGNRDLGGVMLHELGHALGLGHDANGRLMSAHYSGNNQRCIDRAAVMALAAKR